MFGPHEAWLPLGAAAFYLFDSMVFLYADQLLVERAGGRWRPQRGSPMLLAGRRPFLPNPLAPHRSLLAVSLERLLGERTADASKAGELGAGGSAACRLEAMLAGLFPLRVLALVLLMLFAILPGLLYVEGTGTAFLVWLGCVYSVVLSMAGVVWHRRHALGLPPGAAVKLGFECIACSPMAINIVRRVTLRAGIPDLEAARRLLDADAFGQLSNAIRQMLDEREVELAPGEALTARLDGYRRRLRAGEQQ